VIAVGDKVTEFQLGDRVAGTFFAEWVDGKSSPAALGSARGGNINGMLSEMVVASEQSLVKVPSHLSYEEAATLPCAGLTAFNGLFTAGNLQKDEFVLLEGTGGVSTFGLLFAAATGAKAIITSSKDDKLEKAKKMGAVGTVNYRTNPEWQDAVLELTGGVGVDHILEVGGARTLPKAITTLAHGGHMANIGGLTGFDSNIPVGALVGRNASATGIYVGSKANFQAMNLFIEEHKIKPLIDRVFSFEDTPAAFDYMLNSSFMGKIVISLAP
jgi:NADPH:quinone reductase-like Zn-dependent oxidoreductase